HGPHRCAIAGPRRRRLLERDRQCRTGYRRQLPRELVMNESCDELRRRAPVVEGGVIVEVFVIDRVQYLPQGGAQKSDVDCDAVLVELLALDLDTDDVRRAVQPLRRPEDLPVETMSDHDVITHSDRVHAPHYTPVTGSRA